MKKYEAINSLATRIRRHALRMTHKAKSSHIGSNLSVADIVAVLYGGVMNIDPQRPNWDKRDRFILSKGHACAVVYAALAEKGFFPMTQLDDFCSDGSVLMGHINHLVPGVEASTGSLGHGLSIGCGIAMTTKSNVYVLLSDGDVNEGATWEAGMFAHQHKLKNLVAIVDYNGLQALGKPKKILNLEPLTKKWESFGWEVAVTDGHDVPILEALLRNTLERGKRPICIIAYTVKGKGVSFIEAKVEWHYKSPSDEELERALEELG